MFKSKGRLAPVVFCLWVLAGGSQAGPVFINEFHYDNSGADAGEFIELAGLAGTSLSGWSVVLYNGLDGESYFTRDLGSIAAEIPEFDNTGFGFVSFGKAGIQNGPDGIALVHDGAVEEFLSYEGVFTATLGPALGLTSTLIGASESGATPLGGSLQRVGKGYQAADFSWQAFALSSRDAPNQAQTLALPSQPPQLLQSTLPASGWPAWLAALLWSLGGYRRRGRLLLISGAR